MGSRVPPNEDLLAYFRSRPVCEWCLCPPLPGTKLDPHHAGVCRGLGGGSRLDVALNLMGVHRLCHQEIETMGERGRLQCLALIAAREGLEGPDDVMAALWRLLRKPKQ